MSRLASPAVAGRKIGGEGARMLLRAYTLMELLVVVFLIALLMSILVPALVTARHTAKSFVCMDHLRSTSLRFRLFADSYTCGYRGDSAQYGSRFDAMDFFESLYEVGEFWDSKEIHHEAYPGQSRMTCPSAPTGLARYGRDIVPWTPAVAPREKVSFAMNRRLLLAPALKNGVPFEAPVLLTERIFNHPRAPLFFDVDAEAAMKGVSDPTAKFMPFFCTPDYFERNYWFPAMRHRGKMIVSFVGGHVLSTSDPLSEGQWCWDYFPSLGARK
ncbi:MAG: type II secretion system protein [bacterium]|nr:type II secretion system protein [bacterium]